MQDLGPFSLKGKRAVVTGGAMGIGLGIVKRFLEAGAKVLIADIAIDVATRVLKELPEEQRKMVAILKADLLEDGTPERIVSEAVRVFGGIDIFVNNAGIYPMISMMDANPEHFDKVYKINLRSLAFNCKAAATQMIKQGTGGKIINIASIDSVHPSSVGLAAYDASKGGVLMFTKNFALEVAKHGILVNAIAPGDILTEGASKATAAGGLSQEAMKAMMDALIKMIPLGRMGNPDDIAKVAVFLASSAADYMTGSLVIVDGGRLLA